MNKLRLRSIVLSTFLTDEQSVLRVHGLPDDFPGPRFVKFRDVAILVSECFSPHQTELSVAP
jgi:hypothetical protein